MSNEWQKGYDDGKAKALSLDRPFKTEDFPKHFVPRCGEYNSGYQEGVLSGENSKYYTKTPK